MLNDNNVGNLPHANSINSLNKMTEKHVSGEFVMHEADGHDGCGSPHKSNDWWMITMMEEKMCPPCACGVDWLGGGGVVAVRLLSQSILFFWNFRLFWFICHLTVTCVPLGRGEMLYADVGAITHRGAKDLRLKKGGEQKYKIQNTKTKSCIPILCIWRRHRKYTFVLLVSIHPRNVTNISGKSLL